MKEDVFVLKKQMFWSFISHMVQMKEENRNYKDLRRSLYIPHGSDESHIRCHPLS